MDEKESPTIEEGTQETPEEKVDIEALAEKLEQFDVKDPNQLEGKLRNADAYSDVQSQRDLLANELAQVRAEVQNLRKPAQPQETEDYMETGQPVDIESIVANSVNKALDARERRAAEHQQRMNNMWMKISGHKKYHLVKDEFEQALRDPAKVMQIQSGQVDPFEMYTDMVMEKYADVAQQSVKAFKQMQGSTGVAAPHVESSARVPTMTADERNAHDKKLDNLRAKAKENPLGLQHDDQQDEFIDLALGDIFKD